MYLNNIKREVPVTVWVNIFFGGFANQFGWIFFGFGMIFFWIFALNADVSFLVFSGENTLVQGMVTDSRETSASVNETSVYENHYTFIDDREKRVKGFSYATGRWLEEGEPVMVEYPVGKPYYSRIQGMRRKMFGPAVLLVLIFPLAGLAFLLFGLRKAVRANKLLQEGILTTGTLLEKKRTNTTINDQTVYEFIFGFKDRSGRKFKVSEKTHRTYLLQDDREESLLYLKDNPDDAMMLDALPGSPRLGKQGDIEPGSLGSSFRQLIVPLITLSGHGAYFFFAFLR
ncbi:MAG: hypothetical protein QTN59_16840 [Candidatus Electrothrix communis]|nr:MAG: hypothetical protein QTN59_16840 [Candidatus Electrothrix communis]